jgi:DNA-binding transcriptional MerR regulator/methylmalonyl-CoA mutase cobalamin-binding subunit
MGIPETMVSIADLPDDPQYTIKAVCSQTGIRAVTLRAWERRYQLLNPRRAHNQYRRYSEREISILRWVKTRVDTGLAISSVVEEYHNLVNKGQYPEVVPILQLPAGRASPNPPSYYSRELYKALVCADEKLACELLHEAQNGLDLPTLCLEVMTPCLVEIGEAWFRGDLRIATEHFASNFLRGKLLSLFQGFPARRGAPYILAGCAPGEHHELGILMLSTLLRDQGYRVEYLGQDVPLADLAEYAGFEKPALILLSASTDQPALDLAGMQEKLANQKPIPIFAFGGQAFIRNPSLKNKIPGIFLGSTALEALSQIKKLIC